VRLLDDEATAAAKPESGGAARVSAALMQAAWGSGEGFQGAAAAINSLVQSLGVRATRPRRAQPGFKGGGAVGLEGESGLGTTRREG
jgi:hypothetical protein